MTLGTRGLVAGEPPLGRVLVAVEAPKSLGVLGVGAVEVEKRGGHAP
jgi:hypothetical protein